MSQTNSNIRSLVIEHGQNLFLTSDTHFGEQRALELSRRPFINVPEMDMSIISNFNTTLSHSKNNVILHLGDFGDFKRAKEINAEKIFLVLGNYERMELHEQFMGDYNAYINYINSFGITVLTGSILNCLVMEPDGTSSLIKCQHEPELCDKVFVRNAFGHIHGRQKVKRYGIDVGIDAHHFRLVSKETLEFYFNAIQNHYDNNVFE